MLAAPGREEVPITIELGSKLLRMVVALPEADDA
jgi:hypothetical protein